MLATHDHITVYRRNHVLQASPVELVVMLYEKAIQRLTQAVRCLDTNDVAGKGQAVCHAVDIIAELQAVLDKDRGGEIASKLSALYTYMLEQLTHANRENDADRIREVVRLLEELLEGWNGLAQRSARESAAPAPRAVGAAGRQFQIVG
jgi:flagellar protein FliS